MASLKIAKVNALPTPLVADTLYLVKVGTDGFRTVLTDNAGVAKNESAASFNRYDLPMAVSTGALDLSLNQIFRIDTSTAGVRNISFTNLPSRTMVVVIETVGNLGTVSFPANVTVTAGVDPAQGAVKSIFTLFYDTDRFYLLSNGQVN